jgi:uncharacterized protein (TIGR03435 family)
MTILIPEHRRQASIAALCVCAFSATLVGQLTKPTFETASVKRNMSGEPAFNAPRFQDITFTARNVPVDMLISYAYSVATSDLVDGPSWIVMQMTAGERYDVVAKAAERASAEDQRAMVRHLLEDRFALRLRRETRQMSVYFLRPLHDRGRLGPKPSTSGQGLPTTDRVSGPHKRRE